MQQITVRAMELDRIEPEPGGSPCRLHESVTLKSDYPNLELFAKTSAEFAIYIPNNVGLILNHGERWPVESWTPEGAHFLLQTRTYTNRPRT